MDVYLYERLGGVGMTAKGGAMTPEGKVGVKTERATGSLQRAIRHTGAMRLGEL